MAISVQDSEIALSMRYYWSKLFQKYDIAANETEKAPITKKVNRSDCPNEPIKPLKSIYLSTVGSILFGFTHCRLDIAYAIGALTKVMHNPAPVHMGQARHLLKYLNQTKEWDLNFYRDGSIKYNSDFVFFGNVDSSSADNEGCDSTGGWFYFLGEGQGAISARSGTSGDIALSPTEAETMRASNCSKQGAFIKQFLDEPRLFKSVKFELREDSKPMMSAQLKNVSASRFRHLKVKYHYIRRLIYASWCSLVKIDTGDQTADLTTKILPVSTVEKHSRTVLGISVQT